MIRGSQRAAKWAVAAAAVTVSLGTVAFFALDLQDLAQLEGIKGKIKQEFPEVRSVSTDELNRRLDEGESPLLIDVRRLEEYEVSHLPNALQLDPAAQMEEARLAPGPLHQVSQDREIVVYCSVGYRSARMARRLEAAGYQDVRNLEGSIFEWAEKGYPLRQGEVEVYRVHPYSRAWAYLVPEPLRAFTPEEARRQD